jgi:hypothetical protein
MIYLHCSVTVYFSFVIACRSKFGSFLSLGHDHNKLDRLFMKGPEGRGEVEVAVSGIAGPLCLAWEYLFLSVCRLGFTSYAFKVPVVKLLLLLYWFVIRKGTHSTKKT